MSSQSSEQPPKPADMFRLLSEFTLNRPDSGSGLNRIYSAEAYETASRLSRQGLEQLAQLAMTNHVIMRAFRPLQELLEKTGNQQGAKQAAVAVQKEQARINRALVFLERICDALEIGGCPATVIKSLDHWPDLGSDLDLYVGAPSSSVIKIMSSNFRAKTDKRSWGDRLANKWNFIVPDLPELVEVHVERLGQTGEQTALTRSLAARTRTIQVGVNSFRVPAPEDRIVISTLQRMYRHFYIRLCDIVDTAQLADSGIVDYCYLRSLGSHAGLWEGIATYLTIVSDYVRAYRGEGLPLPAFVRSAAKFGPEQVRFGRDFLRVSILPHSMTLYAMELKKLLLNGDIRNCLRLSLLPCLATAAAIEQKTIGTGKGIW